MSNNRRPYCVYVIPGPSSKRTEQFVFSLTTSREENDFLDALKKYSAIARQYPPRSEDLQENLSD